MSIVPPGLNYPASPPGNQLSCWPSKLNNQVLSWAQLLVWSSRSGYQYCYALQFLWVSIIKLAFQASIALLTIQANQSNTELTLQSHHYYHGTPGFNYLLGPTGLNYRASLPDFNCYTGPSDPNCFASHLGLNCYVGHLDLVYSAGPPKPRLLC